MLTELLLRVLLSLKNLMQVAMATFMALSSQTFRLGRLKVLSLRQKPIAIVLAFALSIVGCGESPPEPPAVTIENVFMKALPPGQTTAAAYMKLTNRSKVSQSINYIHSPVAEHIEIHRSFYEDGMMQMRPVKRLTVNPGETKVLEPGGFHLMVFGVYDTFNAGDSFDITFEFDSGIVKTERLTVRPHG